MVTENIDWDELDKLMSDWAYEAFQQGDLELMEEFLTR